MFSGGKDSIVMLHLARKAFWPAPVPFPVLHDPGNVVAEKFGLVYTVPQRGTYVTAPAR